MDIASEYKREQLVKQEQKERIGSVNSTAMHLFIQECLRSGIPSNEDDAIKLIERCFISSASAQDYLHKQFEPFI